MNEDYEVEVRYGGAALTRIEPVEPTGPASSPEADEFQRFEALTRKLVNTPKTAIDEERRRPS